MLEHYIELLSPLGPISARAMFGGHGLYCDGRIIAIVDEGELYLKTDAQTRPSFDEAGCRPFVVEMNGKVGEMKYCTVPDEALESPALMRPWAELALAAAMRQPPKARNTVSTTGNSSGMVAMASVMPARMASIQAAPPRA